MAERPMDVRSTAALLRRRWRVVTVVAAGGLGLGLLYGNTVPLQLSSTSLVLISPGTSASAGATDSAIDTQVQLVQSTPVLARAGASLHPALSAGAVAKRITVDARTTQLIEIEASSPRAAQAQALSQAVAQAFVANTEDNARSVTGATVRELRTRQATLASSVQSVVQQLASVGRRRAAEPSTSPAAVRDAQLVADLTTQQGDLVLQLDRVKAELEATTTSGVLPTVSIAQPAAPATGPGRLPALLTWTLTGALLAAAAAAMIVVVRARRDPRLRARDDLADAVGCSVLVDVHSRPQRSVGEWAALLENYEPSAVDAWAFRQLLRVLSDAQSVNGSGRSGRRRAGRIEHPSSIAVVSLSGDVKALAVAPQLAAFSASLGITTRLVLAAGDKASSSLWAACSIEHAFPLRNNLFLEAGADALDNVRRARPLPDVGSFDDLLGAGRFADDTVQEAERSMVPIFASSAATASPAEDVAGLGESTDEGAPSDRRTPEADEADLVPLTAASRGWLAASRVVARHASRSLTIVLAVADPKEPELKALPSTSTAVLAISPGAGTREDLARLAVAVDDTQRRLDGVVLADPDPADRTTGRHTLDERARQAPLPLRVTGIDPSATGLDDRGMTR